MSRLSPAEQKQKERFDTIADQYAAYEGDKWSQDYRRQFIDEAMVQGLELSDKKVLDAICSSGETTAFLLGKGATVTGVDISSQEIENIRRKLPQRDCLCASILSTGQDSDSFDCVVVVGDRHHLLPNVVEALEETHKILELGGYFYFVEPCVGSLPNKARKISYSQDSMSAENEQYIDTYLLKQQFHEKFGFIIEKHKGSLAYLLVLNSLIFRIPIGWKRYYSAPLIKLESLIEKIQGKTLSCYFVGQWRKHD